ncbi:Aminoglycoside 6-adenylyltransferase [Neolewinella maritima]|uniref:Aminoglycoside 6-adenylyltransferase n=2 Tax=Neolewinella maritima TaxID=1383882 RepID=A0ABN8F471_9BACT|nr:Aminoglycoside 6-adenylyltransferase [Neolewinella maritima]
MRTPHEILNLVSTIAKHDDRVLAALLVGSRANQDIQGDKYQDYDIMYVVDDIKEVVADAQWITVFGDPILMQTPDSMVIPRGDPVTGDTTQRYAYLMLFADYVRIDLTLVELEALGSCVDTPADVLIDKAGVLGSAVDAYSADNFLVTKPSQREFSDCCNEFWWVSTYVTKGLLRAELLYAKGKLERPLRDMLLLMLSWKVGCAFDFAVNLGSEYRFLKRYLDEAAWRKLRNSYPLLDQRSIWESLNAMTNQFEQLEKDVAKQLQYTYCQSDIDAAKKYLMDSFDDISKHF